jgi:hypothetical protein
VTTSTLPSTRSAALDAVPTLTRALREVCVGDDYQARVELSSLSTDELAEILEATTRVLGLLATVEAAKKATR